MAKSTRQYVFDGMEFMREGLRKVGAPEDLVINTHVCRGNYHSTYAFEGGYDPVYANEDLDRVLPVDGVKEMVKAGEIGSLHDYWYATVGNGTSVANSKKFATDIAEQLLADHVEGVILTST